MVVGEYSWCVFGTSVRTDDGISLFCSDWGRGLIIDSAEMYPLYFNFKFLRMCCGVESKELRVGKILEVLL